MKIVFSLICLSIGFFSLGFAKGEESSYYHEDGKAIEGYDPVSYFDKRPQPGVEDWVYHWGGVDWYFVSEKNFKKFKATPEKYVPQYGGYCAWAVASGYTASIDPLAWTVYKDKLYLNYNLSIRNRWARNIPRNIKKGDKNWEKLKDK